MERFAMPRRPIASKRRPTLWNATFSSPTCPSPADTVSLLRGRLSRCRAPSPLRRRTPRRRRRVSSGCARLRRGGPMLRVRCTRLLEWRWRARRPSTRSDSASLPISSSFDELGLADRCHRHAVSRRAPPIPPASTEAWLCRLSGPLRGLRGRRALFHRARHGGGAEMRAPRKHVRRAAITSARY